MRRCSLCRITTTEYEGNDKFLTRGCLDEAMPFALSVVISNHVIGQNQQMTTDANWTNLHNDR